MITAILAALGLVVSYSVLPGGPSAPQPSAPVTSSVVGGGPVAAPPQAADSVVGGGPV